MFHSWVELRAEFKEPFLFGANSHNIIEYPKGIIELQLLAFHRTPQESHHVPESIIQTLLEL